MVVRERGWRKVGSDLQQIRSIVRSWRSKMGHYVRVREAATKNQIVVRRLWGLVTPTTENWGGFSSFKESQNQTKTQRQTERQTEILTRKQDATNIERTIFKCQSICPMYHDIIVWSQHWCANVDQDNNDDYKLMFKSSLGLVAVSSCLSLYLGWGQEECRLSGLS